MGSMITRFTDQIHRPRRDHVEERMLGGEHMRITNARGHALHCTCWDTGSPSVVLFLHGNTSSRLGALSILPYIVGSGLSLFAFDFSGSGNSDGEHVSLGYFEKDDVHAVVREMRKRWKHIILWGHSMGAVTAILYMREDPSITCAICDSAFCDAHQLAADITHMRRALVYPLVHIINYRVRRIAGFNITDIRPLEAAPSTFVPTLFIHARDDKMIPKEHTQRIFEAYAGDAEMHVFPGTHNSPRPIDTIQRALEFIIGNVVETRI